MVLVAAVLAAAGLVTALVFSAATRVREPVTTVSITMFILRVGASGTFGLGAALYAAGFSSPVPAVIRFVAAGVAVTVGTWSMFGLLERRSDRPERPGRE